MSRTVLGPMPTPFSAPADCGGSPRIALRANGTASFNARWGAGCTISGLSSMEVYTESCFPSGLVSWFAGEGLLNTVAAYSPAAGCPQGLQTACSVAKERGQGGAAPTGLDPGLNYVWQGLTEGEMYVGCCPSGWQCQGENHFGCTLGVSAATTLTGYELQPNCDKLTTEMTVPTAQPTPVGIAFRLNILMPAQGTTPNAPAQSTAADTLVNSTEGGETGDNNGGNGGRLSAGAKAGIGVGSAVAVALFASLLFLVLRARRKKKALKAEAAHDGSHAASHKSHAAELDSETMSPDYSRRSELISVNSHLGSRDAVELSTGELSEAARSELPSEQEKLVRYELDSSLIGPKDKP